MGKAKRFNNYDSDVEQQRKLVKSYGLARQNNSVSSFRSIPQSPPTATNTDNEAVVITSSTVTDNSITFAKIQDITTMKVIGRTATGTGDSSEISILDEDDMASNSAVALATQQSIKAYVDANGTSFSGFTADATLDMGDYNIEDVNVLKINSGSANSADSFTMYGTTTAGVINLVDDNDSFIIAVDGTTKFTVRDSQVDIVDDLTMSGNTIYLDSDLDTSIDSYSDDSLQMSVGGNIRLTISNTSTIVTNAFSVLGSTTLGDSAGDLINIPGLVNFTGNYSAVAQTAGNSTGYITILINGSAKKLYYY
jgi:hypothetical protein